MYTMLAEVDAGGQKCRVPRVIRRLTRTEEGKGGQSAHTH